MTDKHQDGDSERTCNFENSIMIVKMIIYYERAFLNQVLFPIHQKDTQDNDLISNFLSLCESYLRNIDELLPSTYSSLKLELNESERYASNMLDAVSSIISNLFEILDNQSLLDKLFKEKSYAVATNNVDTITLSLSQCVGLMATRLCVAFGQITGLNYRLMVSSNLMQEDTEINPHLISCHSKDSLELAVQGFAIWSKDIKNTILSSNDIDKDISLSQQIEDIFKPLENSNLEIKPNSSTELESIISTYCDAVFNIDNLITYEEITDEIKTDLITTTKFIEFWIAEAEVCIAENSK